MDFETFLRALAAIFAQGSDLYCLLYAVATCIFTQIVKKIFVNKVKVDVLHKFDFASILPFLFGAVFAVIDVLLVRKTPFGWNFAGEIIAQTATVGALSSVIFKAISAMSGGSLKALLKDDVCGVFYTQLLYFGNVRQQLLDKQIKLKDFVAQVKLLAKNATAIYQSNDNDVIKKDKLHRLLAGIIDAASIQACVDVLDRALVAVFAKPTDDSAANNK